MKDLICLGIRFEHDIYLKLEAYVIWKNTVSQSQFFIVHLTYIVIELWDRNKK